MPGARLVRLILWVRDPVALATWYCETFSWKEQVREEAEGWIEIDANGFLLALHGGTDLKPRRWPKIQIAVDDVTQYRAKSMQTGIKMSKIYHWKHLEWSECRDPEGNTVQICNH